MRKSPASSLLVLFLLFTTSLVGCSRPVEPSSVQDVAQLTIQPTYTPTAASTGTVIAPTATPTATLADAMASNASAPASPLATPDIAQLQPVAYEHGPGPVGTPTPTPIWVRYTDPTGRVSFELPDAWTIVPFEETERSQILILTSSKVITEVYALADQMMISISTQPGADRKHSAPWFVVKRTPGRTEYYDMSHRVKQLTPTYVPDATGFIYLMEEWLAMDPQHPGADLSAVFYNTNDEVLVTFRGARTDYGLQERAFNSDLRAALRDEHSIFLHIVDSLRIGTGESP